VTERKDFKRVVRARALRTGESYSSALRNLRKPQDRTAAAASKGIHEKVPPMTISRAIPEVRTTNVEKTVRFYTELLGFDLSNEHGRTAFVSSSHPGVEVRLNDSDFPLPPGFTVELETRADLGGHPVERDERRAADRRRHVGEDAAPVSQGRPPGGRPPPIGPRGAPRPAGPSAIRDRGDGGRRARRRRARSR